MCKDEHTDDTLESTLGEELPNIAMTLKNYKIIIVIIVIYYVFVIKIYLRYKIM